MNQRKLLISFHFLIICYALVLFDEIPVCSTFNPYATCSNKFRCGDTEADFPFWGGDRLEVCGYPDLKLDCDKNKTTIMVRKVKYQVSKLNQESRTLTIARADFTKGLCSPKYGNTSMDGELINYAAESNEVTLLYGCSSSVRFHIHSDFDCPGEDVIVVSGNPGDNGGGSCRSAVTVRVSAIGKDFNVSAIERALEEGFDVRYKDDDRCDECKDSGGVCGYDWYSNQTTCRCPENPEAVSGVSTCSSSEPGSEGQVQNKDAESAGNSSKKQLQMAVGLSVAGAFILLMFIGGFACFFVRRRKTEQAKAVETQTRDISTQPSSKAITEPYTNFFRSTPSGTSYSHSKSDLEKGSTYFGVQVFSYAELEEGTDNFDASRELGEGGFGTVYYGKLHDGRVVAVKRLYENSFKRVEQFMNEVEILTKLHHPNLVKLYGCTSRRSKELLLVYEYISNGTVADHLHGNRSKSGPLSWPVRLNIAIETAEALAYLHRTDIIHRDVKTNNILLDDQFRVKVADFGLSKLFPTDVTHVSTAPQGTPGYVDPEYYQCYHLTTKSDVYSFGVVLIELLSSLQAVDTSRHRHDINLANMAITKIQSRSVGELVDRSLGFEEDEEVRRMATDMAELAFRCIQQERDMRPSMEEAAAALRAIRGEDPMVQVAEVVDIRAEDVGLLRNVPPPLSPDSSAADKWMD